MLSLKRERLQKDKTRLKNFISVDWMFLIVLTFSNYIILFASTEWMANCAHGYCKIIVRHTRKKNRFKRMNFSRKARGNLTTCCYHLLLFIVASSKVLTKFSDPRNVHVECGLCYFWIFCAIKMKYWKIVLSLLMF